MFQSAHGPVREAKPADGAGGVFLPVNKAVAAKDNDTAVSSSTLKIPLKGKL
jgi:hypothetical protein